MSKHDLHHHECKMGLQTVIQIVSNRFYRPLNPEKPSPMLPKSV